MKYNIENPEGMPLNNPDSQALERESEPRVIIEDLESYTGKKLEECAEKSTAPNIPFREASQALTQKRIQEYRENAREKIEVFRGQVEHCVKFAREKGWLMGNPHIRVVIDDKLINATGKLPSNTDGMFDHETGIIFVVGTMPNILLAHEVGHALSANLTDEKKEIGFSRISKSPDGFLQDEGNSWLNEGTTVLWQELTVNDGSIAENQREDYSAFRDATLALIRKMGITQDDLFKAYFGDKDARDNVEQKIKATFGCSLHDLELVRAYSFADHTMEKIINGEHVVIEIEPDTQQEIKDDQLKLASIFPNIEIVRK